MKADAQSNPIHRIAYFTTLSSRLSSLAPFSLRWSWLYTSGECSYVAVFHVSTWTDEGQGLGRLRLFQSVQILPSLRFSALSLT